MPRTETASDAPDRADPSARKDPYLLESVAHACEVLKLFRPDLERMSLKDVVARSGLNKTVAFRLLHTLEKYGLLERSGTEYSCAVGFIGTRRFTIGYAEQTSDSVFSAAVTEGLRQAADREGAKLVMLDNQYCAKTAIRNAESLIRQRVELAIEFQTFESVAPMIGARFREEGIPLIAVEIPHPGATYFGADNYRAGLTAGRALGRWTKQNWAGRADQVLLLELHAAGALPQLRLTGIIDAIRSILGLLEKCFVHLNTRGDFACAMQRVRHHLRNAPGKKILIGGVNDPSLLGALRAFEEAGRLADCAAMGMGAIREARAEMRRPNSRLIGSVAFFPERYGSELMRLALNILNRKHTPPAVYIEHALITPGNVNHFYPNDGPELANTEDLIARHGFR